MEDVPRTTGLQRRNGTYYLRLKIPEDVREHFGGKTEFVKSLRTKDFNEARTLLHVERATFEASVGNARRGRDTKSETPITRPDVALIVWEWFSTQASEMRREIENASSETRCNIEENLRIDEAHLLSRDDRSASEAVQSTASKLIADRKLQIELGSDLFHELCDRIHRGLIEIHKQARELLGGERYAQTLDPMFAEPPMTRQDAITLAELIEKFDTDPSRPDRSRKKATEYGLLFRALKEIAGDDADVRTIDRQTCRDVRDLLLGLPTNATKKFPDMPLAKIVELSKRRSPPKLKPNTVWSSPGLMDTFPL